MITEVALRFLYLIFDRLVSWLVLLGRASSSKDIELLVLGHPGWVVDEATPHQVGGEDVDVRGGHLPCRVRGHRFSSRMRS
jgi:hypothetical protein